MYNPNTEFVSIESAKGFQDDISEKSYPEMIPETIISNNPIELQEVYFSSNQKGYRYTYGPYSSTTINFDTSTFSLSPQSRLHNHDYFEIIFFTSDRFEMQIESQICEFNKWDFCFLNRNTRHAEHFSSDCKLYYLLLSPAYIFNWPIETGIKQLHSKDFTLFFDKKLLDSTHHNKDYLIAHYNNAEPISHAHKILLEIKHELQSRQPGYLLFIRGLIFRLFTILTDLNYYQIQHVDLGNDSGFSLALSAKQLLDKNRRKMTNKELALSLNYNAEYINRVFKKHYDYSLNEYNQLVCMKYAAWLLNNSTLSVQQICKKLGYSNRTHFYNLFQQHYHCSPGAYRHHQYKSL